MKLRAADCKKGFLQKAFASFAAMRVSGIFTFPARCGLIEPKEGEPSRSFLGRAHQGRANPPALIQQCREAGVPRKALTGSLGYRHIFADVQFSPVDPFAAVRPNPPVDQRRDCGDPHRFVSGAERFLEALEKGCRPRTGSRGYAKCRRPSGIILVVCVRKGHWTN